MWKPVNLLVLLPVMRKPVDLSVLASGSVLSAGDVMVEALLWRLQSRDSRVNISKTRSEIFVSSSPDHSLRRVAQPVEC